MNADTYYLRNGNRPSLMTTRRVWAELTRDPGVTIRQIAAQIGRSYSVVHCAIVVLGEAGYVEYEPGACRARRIIVPFYLLEKEVDVG